MGDNPRSVCAAILGMLEDVFDQADAKMGQRVVAVGGVITDGCCDGLLVVAPENSFRTSFQAFPLVTPVDESCAEPVVAITILVIANRCLVPVDQKGRAPKQSVQQAVYDVVFEDARLVWSVLSSADVLGDDGAGDPAWQRAALNQTFTSEAGGCLGSETRVTFGIPGGVWCE